LTERKGDDKARPTMDLKNIAEKPPQPGYFTLCNDDGEFRVLDANGRKYRLRPEPGTPVHYVAGTAQVETATVTAASGATSNGDLVVTVTAAGMAGSPLAVNVPLTTDEDSADLVAAEIRSVLGATAAITSMFNVGGTGATVTLTRNTVAANDGTLNIGIAAGLGVSAAASSANTTAGVARVMATEASKGDQLIDEDFLYTATANVSLTSTSGWEKSAVAAL
jgi:hypothetical protein